MAVCARAVGHLIRDVKKRALYPIVCGPPCRRPVSCALAFHLTTTSCTSDSAVGPRVGRLVPAWSFLSVPELT